MKKVFFFFVLLISCSVFGQFRNNIWCFGDSAGIDFNNVNNPVPIATSLDTRGSCVSIADSLGNLLFYAATRATGTYGCNATIIYNNQNQPMDNGDSIMGEGWYKELLIIPVPSHPSLFYLFSSVEVGCTNPSPGLYYSLIDLSLNSGLGRVIMKNISIISVQPNDGLAAIRHGNGRDWWLLFRQWDYISSNNYDEFYSLLITPDSISSIITQHIGSVSNNGFYRIEPSWDGLKIACSEMRGLIEIFDFDRCSGLLSNPLTIEANRPQFSTYPDYWSCKLSPGKNRLYVSSVYNGVDQDSSYLFQYDLTAPNIAASRITLASLKEPAVSGLLELAPDHKIYFSIDYESAVIYTYPYPDSIRSYINENLSVINYPDSFGSACNFQLFSFPLSGKRTYFGLPNNPNYELPAWGGSICDTLGIWNQNSNDGIITQQGKLHVFYHPDWQTAFINADGLKGRYYTLHISDISGKEIFFENGSLASQYYTKDFHCEKLSNGVYLVLFETEKERMVKRFVVE